MMSFAVERAPESAPEELRVVLPSSIWTVADAIPGCFSHVEAALLYSLARRVGPGGQAVEIGSWQGRSTVVIAHGLHAPDTKLHTIDDHRGIETEIGKIDSTDLRKKFEANLGRAAVLHKIVHHAESSKSAGAGWKVLLDLLFIDGDHSSEGVQTDIAHFVPHVKPGGWVACHDAIRPSWPEVFPAACHWMLQEPRGIAQMMVAGSVLAARLAAAGESGIPAEDLRGDLDLAWRTVREWKKGDFAGKYRSKIAQALNRWRLRHRGMMIPRRFDQSDSL